MRWVGRIGVGLLVLIVAATAIVYAVSEYQIRRDRGAKLGTVVADASPAGVIEGERLARLHGCYSCHGPAGHGVVMVDILAVATLTAPPLAIAARSSDAELARTLQQAVGRDGAALWIMPAHPRVAENELAMLMGHLRTLRPSPADIVRRRGFGPLGRVLMLTGKLMPTTHIGQEASRTPPTDRGAYLTDTVCQGCHLLDKAQPFSGGDRQIAPPLAMMGAAYDDAAFVRLLRTGQGMKPGNLGIMTEVAREAFSRFRDDEIAAIHTYLRRKAAERPAN